MMTSNKKRNSFNAAQLQAVDPTISAFVQANAGTGKTAVLTGRLLRILFFMEKLDTAGVLCLTYTKAGASEMNNRILAEMRKLAVADDETLAELVRDIIMPRAVTSADIEHARQIFYAYIDNPDILTVKTIHSFCEEILHRFPLEAGISPGWNLVTDSIQNRLWRDAFFRMINNAKRAPSESDRLLTAFERVLETVSDSDQSINKLIERLSGQYKHFFKLNNFDNYREYFINTTKKILNLQNQISDEPDAIVLRQILEVAESRPNPNDELVNMITKTKQYIDKTIDFEEYKNAYLTGDKKRKRGMPTDEIFQNELERVYELNQQKKRQAVFENTVMLFELSSEFARTYKQIKKEQNLLDFEDLILYTEQLFSNQETMGWVLSQLNTSVNHILLDEAQDTAPDQLEVIESLLSTIMTAAGRDNLPPTIFVVGDTKQSIYSFQGAEPEKFANSRQVFERQIAESRLVFKEPVLDINYRSVAPILSTVDEVFDNIDGFVNNKHRCSEDNKDKPGVVEVHQIVDACDGNITLNQYLDNIVDEIYNLTKEGDVKPSEIMVLVRGRAPMAPLIVKKMKAKKIEVAGSDVIVLPEFSVIRDLMHLVRFCIDNANDYSLCCVLKSPLFLLSEADIFNICKIRKDENEQRKRQDSKSTTISVFDVLQQTHPQIYEYLKTVTKWAADLSAYSFFTNVLSHDNTRQKIIGALGAQVLEPLDEFMNLCLSYERTEPGTMRDFIKWFITSSSKIKRDVNHADGVRVITVHGSKGLQARVVFMIDTATLPYVDKADVVQISADTLSRLGAQYNPAFPLPWVTYLPATIEDENVAIIRDAATQATMAEYYRLLYVAMTRACQRLYIYGIRAKTTHGAPESWICRVWDILSRDETRFTDETHNVLRITNDTTK